MKSNTFSLIIKSLSLLLIAIAILVIFTDALKVENSWNHPELAFYQIKYLSNETFDRITLSFDLSELKKVLWWEEVFDGCQNRIVTGFVDFINIKFRAKLFQWMAPHQSISITWVIVLLLNPYFHDRIHNSWS